MDDNVQLSSVGPSGGKQLQLQPAAPTGSLASSNNSRPAAKFVAAEEIIVNTYKNIKVEEVLHRQNLTASASRWTNTM